jgi:UDP-N-acetylmuramoylalanine--D-glutamate ligase
MTTHPDNWTHLIVGLGQTGLSVAYYLARKGIAFAVVDSRENPPGKVELLKDFPTVMTQFGEFQTATFVKAAHLIVSPGVAVATPAIQAAKQHGAEIIGDIELFVREANAPIIAITGSNGKSTVTTLVAEMAEQADWQVYAGGNLGTTSLDLLQRPTADLYVMELSSFQLETTYSLQAVAAVILNLCEDHMDRYDHFDDYVAAKQVIFNNSDCVVINRDDVLVKALNSDLSSSSKNTVVSFGLDSPEVGQYGLNDGYLMQGMQRLMHCSEMKVQGAHNIANALSALALGDAANIPMPAMLAAIRAFTGLEHRTQWVAEIDAVQWFNDSKGTNVGATIAALAGLSGKTVLIAGGQAKGADFSSLAPIVQQKARAVVLMGEDRADIAQALAAVIDTNTPLVYADTMQQAVELACQLAQKNDNVLLSPACASFDMFRSYIHRGEVFMDAVRSLPQ